MRILHTSDWHLGQFFYGQSRQNEHQQFFTWLLAQVDSLAIDAIIVAGDIFDTGSPPSYARELYFNFIADLYKKNCTLVVIAGNHDSAAMLGESQTLLKNFGTHVVPITSLDTELPLITLTNKQGLVGAVICAIPFIRPRDLVRSQAGQSAQEKNQSLQQAIKQYYQQSYQQAQLRVEQLLGLSDQQHIPIIATGHLTAVGARTSDSVRDIYIGTLEAFSAHDFPAADYIALGHIHQAQQVAKSETIRYCGSPIPLSFDELSYDKKVLLLDFATESNKAPALTVTELTIPRFQPMALVTATLATLASTIENILAEQTLSDQQVIWLALEIASAEYLSDLSQQVEKICAQYPVELLFIKRKNANNNALSAEAEQITLSELTVTDVFKARLAQESWHDDEQIAQQQRLQTLFAQVVEQVSSGTSEAELLEISSTKVKQ